MALGALLLAPAITFAQTAQPTPTDGVVVGNTTAGKGIANSPHDFAGGSAVTDKNVGLCTYCHTPHHAQQSRLLWNHTLSLNSFSWSDAKTTTGGTTLPTITPAYTGATVKCLSCHDGTVAIGDVSWYKESVQNAGGTNTGDTDLADKVGTGILTGNLDSNGNSEFLIAPGGDLKGNHPVAVPFPFNNVASVYNGSTTGSAVNLAEWQADPQANGIRLFTDNTGGGTNIVAGATAGKAGIECSSCHDPHNKAAVEDLFLRGYLTGNDSNYICNKCHSK